MGLVAGPRRPISTPMSTPIDGRIVQPHVVVEINRASHLPQRALAGSPRCTRPAYMHTNPSRVRAK